MKAPDNGDTLEASEARKLTARNELARLQEKISLDLEEDRRLCERFTAEVWPAIRAAVKQGNYVAYINVPLLKTAMDPVSSVIEDLRKLGYWAEVKPKCFSISKVLVVGWS